MRILTLASGSAARAEMLERAGVRFRVAPTTLDEEALKAALVADGAKPREVADALAEAKAVKASHNHDGLVLAGDTALELDGALLDKPVDLCAARRQLRLLRGARHRLHTAAVIAVGGRPIWRHLETAILDMRPFSDDFLEAYLQSEGSALLSSVGAYRLEGLGAQLFSAVRGDYFAILGLPLIQVLDALRTQEVLSR